MTAKRSERRRPCVPHCDCLCHDTGGGVHDHEGEPCPGKSKGLASAHCDVCRGPLPLDGGYAKGDGTALGTTIRACSKTCLRRREATDAPATARVAIDYFKPSGKWYTRDANVEWPRDATHHSGWLPFAKLARIKSMVAVCLDSPLGFPQMAPATVKTCGRCGDALPDAPAALCAICAR